MLKHASRPALLVHTESESFATDLRAQLEKEGVAIRCVTDRMGRKAAQLAEGAGTCAGVAPHEKPIQEMGTASLMIWSNADKQGMGVPADSSGPRDVRQTYGTRAEDRYCSDGFAVVYAKQSVNVSPSCSNVPGASGRSAY